MAIQRSPCPICGKPAEPKTACFPFCGQRCRTRDLANWSTGEYSVPVPANEADEQVDLSGAPLGGATDD